MEKIIKQVKKDVLQITIADERWYVIGSEGQEEYIPSVTWIASHYPKGVGYYKWLAQKGWDEAEAIKVAAGDKGSKVHHAIGDLIEGKTVAMDSKYINSTTKKEEELTLGEYECLMSFVSWVQTFRPKFLAKELVLINKEYGYAGTADLIYQDIDDKIWIVDIKTSQNIWPEMELQVSAYFHALKDSFQNIDGCAILQVGYRKNKANYKLTEIEDKFDLFLAARKIWANETKGQEPLKKDYPVSLRIEELSPPRQGRK